MQKVLLYLAPLLVAVASYFTYVRGYSDPNNFFWDENYHVASAQKYLNGIFFMEPHAPLGKLMIALGEKLLHSNETNAQFVDTDYAKSAPAHFSFRGYRFVPVACAWITALLLYAMFFEITKRPLWALLLSSLYVFDNTLIVHARGAMLDGIQLLFLVGTLLLSLRVRNGHRDALTYVLLGFMFGAGFAAKENGVLLAPALLMPMFALRRSWRPQLSYVAAVGGSAFATFVGVWWIALALSNTVNPKLEKNGWYHASAELKEEILTHSRSPRALYYFMRDSAAYAEEYHERVPELNYCKIDENGSYPLFWPLGGRAINYRWQKGADSAQFLYLQINPAIWLAALVSIVAAVALCITRLLGQRRTLLAHEDFLVTLVAMYLIYFAAVLSVNRVFYLYHYFVPLLYCFSLCAILVNDLGADVAGINSSTRSSIVKSTLLTVMAVVIFGAFNFFAPLTYYRPITEQAFQKRAWLRLWDLTWLNQPRKDPIARADIQKAVPKEQHAQFPELYISGLRAQSVSQQWGEAKQDITVDGNPLSVAGVTYASGIGVHAKATIDFPVHKQFAHFSGLAGVADEVGNGSASVAFEVLGDGKVLWNSEAVMPGMKAVPIEVEIKDVTVLSLVAKPTGSAIDYDHACWLNPILSH